MKAFTKKIVLENGREFYGYGFGADREAINEIVFNTSMVGYQEIMSDPSYTDQMVVMTYPLIGNYGMADEDYETKTPTIGGMIVREYNDSPSNFRYTKTLNEVFEEHDIPAIWGVDTRALTLPAPPRRRAFWPACRPSIPRWGPACRTRRYNRLYTSSNSPFKAVFNNLRARASCESTVFCGISRMAAISPVA